MRYVVMVVMMMFGCQGPKGDPGPMGLMGESGKGAVNSTTDLAGIDQAGVDLAGQVQPQAITCNPGQSFCATATRVATCTLSGADAILGADCSGAGSATNPTSCVTTGCANGEAACCRRQKQLWKWNFTQPAIAGESYIGIALPLPYISIGRFCGATGIVLNFAALIRQLSACPGNDVYIQASFDRKTISVGTTLSFPTTGLSLTYSAAGTTCSSWSGTVKIDSDLPDWSVTINATCSEAGKTSLQVIGTMSGSE